MTSETAIKVIIFSGEVKDWSMWEEKFLAKSKKKGYKEILTGKVKVPKEEGTETASERKTREDIEEKNEDAYSDLILSFADTEAGNVAFSIVINAKTEDLSDGDTNLAWATLKKKFAPQTAPTEMSLYSDFHSSKLQDGADPDVWICHLEDLRIRLGEMGAKMEDRIFLMHVLNNLTQEYEHTVQMLENRNSATANDPISMTRSNYISPLEGSQRFSTCTSKSENPRRLINSSTRTAKWTYYASGTCSKYPHIFKMKNYSLNCTTSTNTKISSS